MDFLANASGFHSKRNFKTYASGYHCPDPVSFSDKETYTRLSPRNLDLYNNAYSTPLTYADSHFRPPPANVNKICEYNPSSTVRFCKFLLSTDLRRTVCKYLLNPFAAKPRVRAARGSNVQPVPHPVHRSVPLGLDRVKPLRPNRRSVVSVGTGGSGR